MVKLKYDGTELADVVQRPHCTESTFERESELSVRSASHAALVRSIAAHSSSSSVCCVF